MCPAKLSFKNEGEIKTFPDEQKLREFVTTRVALEEVLKGVLQRQRTLDHNPKLYGEIEISVKINTWAIIIASIIVTMVYNCTLCFLNDLRDQYI